LPLCHDGASGYPGQPNRSIHSGINEGEFPCDP